MSCSLRASLALAASILAPITACGSDGGGTTAPPPSPAGNYVLTSVRGSALPALIDVTAGDSSFVTDGVLVLGDQGIWNEFASTRDIDSMFGVFTHTAHLSGTYMVDGDSITFVALSPTVTSWGGSFTGSTLTFNFSAGPWTFARQ